MRRLALLSAGLILACGGTERPPPGGHDAPPDLTPPVTSVEPGGGTFVGAVNVVLTAGEDATIFWTVDGSDPATSGSASSGESPRTILLEPTRRVTLRFFAQDAAGNREDVQEASFTILRDLDAASISGRIHVHVLLEEGSVSVGLYDHQPGEGSEPLRYTVLGKVRSSVAYEFQRLDAGEYWVATAWWPGGVQGPPGAFVVTEVGVELDPADEDRRRADFVDLHLGRCAPGSVGVEGEVVVAGRLSSHFVWVGAMEKPMVAAEHQEPVAGALGIGTGQRRPYAICGVEPQELHLVAAASQGGDPEELAAHHANPIVVDRLVRRDLWLGSRHPELGTISGTVRLPSPMPGHKVQVVLSNEPPSDRTPLVRLTTVPLNAVATEYAYLLPALADGTYYVIALVHGPGDPQFVMHPWPVSLAPEQRERVVDLDVPAR